MKSNHALDEIQVTAIKSCTILAAVTSECSVKRVIIKTWTGTLANGADQDQTSENAASNHGLHCLVTLQEAKG